MTDSLYKKSLYHISVKFENNTDKLTINEVQALLSQYVMNFNVAYITSTFLMVLQMQTEKYPMKVHSSLESAPGASSSYTTVWSESTYREGLQFSLLEAQQFQTLLHR